MTHTGGWIANNLAASTSPAAPRCTSTPVRRRLALAMVLGKRRGFGREAMRPHNLPLVMIGAGLLWFGWFGFNAGSALAANNTAAVVWVNTLVATGAATLGWLLGRRSATVTPTSLGAASGVVAGLVAITPACSSVSPIGAIIVGAIAGVLCALAVGLKYRLGYDDSLDVVGVHLVGGLVGTILIGFLATAGAPRRVSTASSTVAVSTSCGGRSSVRWRCWGSPFVADVDHRLPHPEDHRLPDHRGGRGHRHRQRGPRGVGLRLRLARQQRFDRTIGRPGASAEARNTEGVGA